MHILLAEDDCRLGNLVQHMLKKKDIVADWVQCGNMALEYAAHTFYDVIILDWMMPEKSGIEVCAQLRAQGYQGGILMLTAKDAVESRVLGLDSGADDYLIKPFEFAELLARIRALSRRAFLPFQEEVIRLGNLTLNKSARTVQKNGEEIKLTKKEFQLLDLLVQNKGQVLSRDILLDRVWGLESEVSQNNLEAFIRLLRKKIEAETSLVNIQNVRGVGYRLEVLEGSDV